MDLVQWLGIATTLERSEKAFNGPQALGFIRGDIAKPSPQPTDAARLMGILLPRADAGAEEDLRVERSGRTFGAPQVVGLIGTTVRSWVPCRQAPIARPMGMLSLVLIPVRKRA